ncbi:MAG: HU family DNA-binding protein [Ignavibacteriae bacterium]|nr:HU family DNA-binding protein [Ignavibacteriota bacterium]
MENKKSERVRTLTRTDIEAKLEDKLTGKKLTHKLIVDSFIESLREMVMEADPVIRIEIRDFGVFEVKKTKAKPKARNINTGEFIYVPESRKVHFKPGKVLKEFLRKK